MNTYYRLPTYGCVVSFISFDQIREKRDHYDILTLFTYNNEVVVNTNQNDYMMSVNILRTHYLPRVVFICTNRINIIVDFTTQ